MWWYVVVAVVMLVVGFWLGTRFAFRLARATITETLEQLRSEGWIWIDPTDAERLQDVVSFEVFSDEPRYSPYLH